MIQIFVGGSMKSTGEIIREKRQLKGYTATKLAEEFGVSQSYITAIENNRKSPSKEMLEKMVGLIYLDSSDLKHIEEYERFRRLPKEAQEKLMQLERIRQGKIEGSDIKTKFKKINVYGMVSAGNGVIDSADIIEKEVLLPDGLSLHNNDFCVKVSGDSMEPALYSGDLVLVDTTLCSDWRMYNRKIVVILYNGDRLVKKVVIQNYRVEFHSLNEFYEPIIPTRADEVKCVGIVTALLYRDYSRVKF